MPHDIYVPPPRDVGRPANVGDKVVVELREWESRHANPEGEIIEVLGSPDEEGVDMLSVLRQYDLPLHFPKHVLAGGARHRHERPAARTGRTRGLPPPHRRHHRPGRREGFRRRHLSAAGLDHDQWKLWVHIADVSHYVKPGTALDDEARKRGNSTYLVDRVIPMLPEALSNELCSLKPARGPPDEMRGIPDLQRGPGAEIEILSGGHPFAAAVQLQGSASVLQRPPGDPIERMLHDAHRARAADPARCASRPARSTWIFRR